MIAPCKDCERKGCGSYHDECEKFKEYKKEMRARNKHELADTYALENASRITTHLLKKGKYRHIKNSFY